MLCAMAETSTLRPGGEWEMALNRPQHFLGLMSQLGQSRHFDDASFISGLPLPAQPVDAIQSGCLKGAMNGLMHRSNSSVGQSGG